MIHRSARISALKTIVRATFTLILGFVMLYSAGVYANTTEAKNTNNKVAITVFDAATNEPIPSAQITAINHKISAVTDDNGGTEMDIISENEVLEIRAYGFSTREVPVRGRSNIQVGLYSDTFSEDYKTIQGLTGEKRKSHVPVSVSVADDFESTSAISLDEIIQSELNGQLRAISRSDLGGIGSSMFIRGFNSLNSNAQPLIVVDGVIWNSFYDVESLHDGYFTNSLADIDIRDIKSINVIKDGASIYGSKAANGIILINTKRGEGMATKIAFRAFGGVSEEPESLPLMDGSQYRVYASELLSQLDISQAGIAGVSFLQTDPSKRDYKIYNNITNWDEEVYRKATTQSYFINVNGGDERALYNFSVGYTGKREPVKSMDMQRLNTRFNADFTLTDNVFLGMNIGFTNIDRNLLDDGFNYYTSPTYLAMIKAPFLSPYSYTITGTQTESVDDSDIFGVSNPSAIIVNSLNASKHYRLNMGAKPKIQFSPNLSLSSQFDYSLDKVKETWYSPVIGVADQYLPGYGISENSFKSQTMRNVAIYDDTQLKYNNLLGQNHRLAAILGWRYSTNYYESDFGESHNTGSDQKRNLGDGSDFRKSLGINDKIRYISNYLNVDYSFDNRYILQVSVAMDGSSRFGEDTEGGIQLFGRSWGVFPSVNAAWLISSEKFMAGAGAINHLKLRAGYGITGNDDIPAYAFTAYFNSIRYMDRANGLVLGNIGNTKIQWETTAKVNAGIDAHLFNERINISADVYSNKTSDLLNLIPVPEIAGTGLYWANGGELSNEGIEAMLNVKMLNLKSLKWEVTANAGHYTNEITSLPNGEFTTSVYGAEILSSVGNPAGVFYGYETNGVFTGEAEADNANLKMFDENGNELFFAAGDVHFTDQNSDGIIDENDKTIIGDPNPDVYGSFASNIMVGNLRLDALFTFSYGNEVYNHIRKQLESGSGFVNQTTAMLTRWTAEGQQTEMPKATYGDPVGNARFSDRWIEDGSYLRLKALTISYEVPLKSNVFDGLSIWASGRNLWTYTEYLGRDPEVSAGNEVLSQGIDIGLLPSTRSYFVGIKLNL